jgi:hypothetical protein
MEAQAKMSFSQRQLIAARCFAEGNGVYTMRPYRPEFLWMLGMLHRLREIRPDNAKGLLIQTKLFLDDFIHSPDNIRECGFNKVLAATAMPLALINAILKDNDDALFANQQYFDTTKMLLLTFLDQIESKLIEDVGDLQIYVLEEKRGYSIKTLLTNIEETFPEADREMLSDFARDNMQEAGACLAFHRYTGCGYHMARAVEEVARRYYELVTGRSTKYKDKNDEWRYRPLAQIAEELEQVLDKANDDDPGLLALIVPTLRQFCRIYRTPLSHADPELKELEASDAEIAFGHAVSGISTMLEDVRLGAPYLRSIWKT